MFVLRLLRKSHLGTTIQNGGCGIVVGVCGMFFRKEYKNVYVSTNRNDTYNFCDGQ